MGYHVRREMQTTIPSATRILLTTSAAIFATEVVIMFAIQQVNIENPVIEALIDASVLTLVLFPVLYFSIFQTMVRKNRTLKEAEEALRQVQRDLEDRVDERTGELRESNDRLTGVLRRLESHNREMEVLGEMGHLFQACRDPEEAYEVAVGHIRRLLEGTSGALYLFRSSRNTLEWVVEWKAAGQFGQSFVPDDCWALRRGKAHVTIRDNAAVGCRHHSLAKGTKGICLPISASGEILGVLCLHAPDEGGAVPGCNTEEVMPFLTAVAENLALAIANIRFREILRNQALRDQLTGLYNRRFLEETMELELHRAARNGDPFSLIMVDVDRFKEFNDANGHDAGDAVLSGIGTYMQKHLRKGDIPCRFGGEEFAVLMPKADPASAARCAEELREGIESLAIQHDGKDIGSVTVSCGVATFPAHAEDKKDLLRAADQALYASKGNGRNRVTLAEERVATPPRSSDSSNSVEGIVPILS
jgi:diguanylate cyclase (GGDEF)-like protein